MSSIAFLGLGAMGSRMAQRLLNAGHELTVWNRTQARGDELVAGGATWASTPGEATEGAEIVISMVTDDVASRGVWCHPETGALAAMKPGAIAVESSTLTRRWVLGLAEAATGAGVELIDAPVAGSRPQAEAGQLIYFVGGSDATLERVRPVLETLGGAVHHVGHTGSGMAMKLAVNSLFGVQVAALAEMLGLLRRAGVGVADAVTTLNELPIVSPAVRAVGSGIAAGAFDALFPIDLVAKDFAYITATARDLQTPVAIAQATCDTYERARSQGHGKANINAVAKLFIT